MDSVISTLGYVFNWKKTKVLLAELPNLLNQRVPLVYRDEGSATSGLSRLS
jgi:hypothetical protein